MAVTLFAALSVTSGCGSNDKPSAPATASAPSTSAPMKVTGQPTTTASGLQYWDIVVGTGATAAPGSMVKVHYSGFLTNGQKFDSSRDRGQPFIFPLGAGQVIKGWDEAFALLKVGTVAQLIIPSTLAYGVNGNPPSIPPNSILVFNVTLVSAV